MTYLVVDGYPESARRDLREAGASTGGDLYHRMLKQREPDAQAETIFPADDEALPSVADLKKYNGLLWTGCNLCIHQPDDRVERQVELARRAFAAGVSQFGSCWAIQIAAVAAGGKVDANPRGREMGIARKILLTDAGREHPMYRGKPHTFDGFICHLDEVTELPEGGTLLATNRFTRVQGLEVRHLEGVFWGVQYHPEYTVGEMGSLANARIEALTKEGFFQDEAAAKHYVKRLMTLNEDPSRIDIQWDLSLDEDVLDDDIRQLELVNWLRSVKDD
jgi:GMP synthase (glutamine-hydrolysing)